MYNHLKHTLRDFNPDVFITHVGTNDIPLNKTNIEVPEDIVKLAKTTKTNSENIVISNIVPRKDNYETKVEEIKCNPWRNIQKKRDSFN